jgi:hypothetical protein
MAKYRVSLEIDLDADSLREAAERALEIQRQPDSLATVFKPESGVKAPIFRIPWVPDRRA